MNKTILVTGSSGYVGGIVSKYFKDKYDICCITSKDCDLRNHARVIDEANPKNAFEDNELTVVNLVDAFMGKKIIYVSSDYVFEGNCGNYKEEDEPIPKTVYGKSKLAGEKYGLNNSDNFIVLRTSAIYDEFASFPTFLDNELSSGREVGCFMNTYYSPTYYEDFLSALEKIIENGAIKRGIYHSCGNKTSRFEYGITFAEVFGFSKTLIKESYADTGHWFLFPDLSMNNAWTNQRLGINTTNHKDALVKLKKKNENY